MIQTCSKCGVKYNLETVDKCPCCNFDKSGVFFVKREGDIARFINNESHRIKNTIKAIRGRRTVDPYVQHHSNTWLEQEKMIKLKNT